MYFMEFGNAPRSIDYIYCAVLVIICPRRVEKAKVAKVPILVTQAGPHCIGFRSLHYGEMRRKCVNEQKCSVDWRAPALLYYHLWASYRVVE